LRSSSPFPALLFGLRFPLGKTMQQWHEERFVSSSHRLHPVFHEAAHRHLEELGVDFNRTRFRDSVDMAIARKVSARAAADMDEFMAEFRAARMAGRRFSPEVRELYERLGGQ